MNERISGVFPINIDKGTPVLRSRGPWNKDDIYVYNYNFRDFVIINEGLETERHFIVKNRYNNVSGANTMPPNSLYWEESEKIQFLWAGSIKSDMIDTDSLVVKNLKTNNTGTKIEISSNRNDFRITENNILKVLISPKTATSIESMIEYYSKTVNLYDAPHQFGDELLYDKVIRDRISEYGGSCTIESSISSSSTTSSNTIIDIKSNSILKNLSISKSNQSIPDLFYIDMSEIRNLAIQYYELHCKNLPFQASILFKVDLKTRIFLKNINTNEEFNLTTNHYTLDRTDILFSGTSPGKSTCLLILKNSLNHLTVNSKLKKGKYKLCISSELTSLYSNSCPISVETLNPIDIAKDFFNFLIESLNTTHVDLKLYSLISNISNISVDSDSYGELTGICNNGLYVSSSIDQYYKIFTSNEEIVEDKYLKQFRLRVGRFGENVIHEPPTITFSDAGLILKSDNGIFINSKFCLSQGLGGTEMHSSNSDGNSYNYYELNVDKSKIYLPATKSPGMLMYYSFRKTCNASFVIEPGEDANIRNANTVATSIGMSVSQGKMVMAVSVKRSSSSNTITWNLNII